MSIEGLYYLFDGDGVTQNNQTNRIKARIFTIIYLHNPSQLWVNWKEKKNEKNKNKNICFVWQLWVEKKGCFWILTKAVTSRTLKKDGSGGEIRLQQVRISQIIPIKNFNT